VLLVGLVVNDAICRVLAAVLTLGMVLWWSLLTALMALMEAVLPSSMLTWQMAVVIDGWGSHREVSFAYQRRQWGLG
jgi:hypothetical protein